MNRAEVAKQVFNDPELLNSLNKIVHPVVEKDFHIWKQEHISFDIVVKEAAILFENGGYKKMDFKKHNVEGGFHA